MSQAGAAGEAKTTLEEGVWRLVKFPPTESLVLI
jgi:hypothetical protein